MYKKLGLMCALLRSPEIMLLDEPTNGVDPVSRREFWRILADMRAEGMSVLVATAYLDEGELCDRLLIMHAGRILADAAPAEVRAGHADLEQAMIDRIRAADEGLSHDAFGA
jgi:ABC-2 type transport system ATP-binding protein